MERLFCRPDADVPIQGIEGTHPDDWNPNRNVSLCLLQSMMDGWTASCGKLDQYGMQYSRLFANMCNAGVSVESVKSAAANACTSPTAVNPIMIAA